MDAALLAMSHSPLLGKVDLPEDIAAEVGSAFSAARAFVEDFAPEVVISFSPDHFNGFFYQLMPPFCLGTAATAIGDYGSAAGPLDVPTDLAMQLASSILGRQLDLAVSLDMKVDHGTVQPYEILFGGIDRVPVVPIFINSVAPPFTAMARVRLLGEATGEFARDHELKVLFISSGGLSHDPPVPRLATATDAQREALLGHVETTPELRAAREGRVIAAAEANIRGVPSEAQDLAPEWDRDLLRRLAAGELESMDDWSPDEMAHVAGNSSHEVRTWLAGHAALRAYGDYTIAYDYYRPINELLAGFAVRAVSLRSRASATGSPS
jgi:2,3-dihydroxyphenylpropionate 1,2-dioxygenase